MHEACALFLWSGSLRFMSKTLGSKSQRSFAKLSSQVRAACGSTRPANDANHASNKDAFLAAPNAVGEVSKGMADLYRRFLTEPSAARFQEAFAAFELPAKLPAQSAIPSLLELDQAFSEGRFDTVRTLVQLWSRYFALSVHFHRLAALAALELGELDDAELERFIADACLQGVLSSGDGSANRPYLVAHRADAQEVLSHLKLTPLRQTCVENEGSVCDVFDARAAKGEREVWFSVYSAPGCVGKARLKRAKKVAV